MQNFRPVEYKDEKTSIFKTGWQTYEDKILNADSASDTKGFRVILESCKVTNIKMCENI